MPATKAISALDFSIFSIIVKKNKPTMDEIGEVLKKELDPKKMQSNIRKLQKNGFVIISKKGQCNLSGAGKKEFKLLDKRFTMINSLDKAA